MVLNRKSAHYYAFLFGLTLMVVGLGVSRFLISMGGLILALNWILEGNFAQKFNRLKSNRPALLLLLLFAMHVVWLLNTENFEYAFKDIRIKLPLLLLPVIFGSAPSLKRKVLFNFLWLFVAVVLFGTLLSIGHYFTNHNPDINNIRQIVFFSSPIRFALLLVMGFLFSFYSAITRRIPWLSFAMIAVWIIGYLIFIQSITGLTMLISLLVIFSMYSGFRFASKPLEYALAGLPLLLTTLLIVMIANDFNAYQKPADVADNYAPFDSHSSGGEVYIHDLGNTELENGHYIYRYIAEKELQTSWAERSTFNFWSKDPRGQTISYTVMRYMSSLGLRKDSVGFAQLTDEDIDRIEIGYTTAFPIHNPIYRRLRATYFEVNSFLNGASAQGGSVVQRLIYVENGFKVAKESWLIGVGTGDVNDAILQQYVSDETKLEPDFQRRAHNQYLTFLISFGLLGAVYFLALNIWSVTRAFKHADFMAIGFTVVAALSFLSEDTLETQVGATFYAFFFSFLLVQKVHTSAGKEFRFNELWRNSVDGRLHK